ncbi:MAG: amidase domain-containing protein [Oscillospiraceae bacterium]|nr:amidase domain-containing protein [Oscillospiraceae bacterium]
MTKGKQTSPLRFLRGMATAGVVTGAIWLGYINSEYFAPRENTAADAQQISYEYKTDAKIVDENNLLNEEQKKLLECFALRYAETLCTTEPQDISDLFADSKGADYHKNTAAYKTLTSIRKMSANDLSLESAEIIYRVEETAKKGAGIAIHIKENNVQKFRHLSEPSYSYNLNHLFVLEEVNGEWLIKSHEQEEDFFLLTLEAWDDATGSDSSSKAENTVEILIADAQENIDELKISTGNEPEDIKVTDTSYDRDAAVAYAKEWCDERNYNGKWLAYDLFGGNCQNFASQCIYAGGIDMDSRGDSTCQWKFYSEVLNTKASAWGRSYSWTGVDPFYTYATLNRSSGLICQADMALKYAEKGDIIQVGAYYEWRHSLVVTDVMFADDGSLEDIIVASNTADRWNYPLSAYIYTYPRLIHILGQI